MASASLRTLHEQEPVIPWLPSMARIIAPKPQHFAIGLLNGDYKPRMGGMLHSVPQITLNNLVILSAADVHEVNLGEVEGPLRPTPWVRLFECHEKADRMELLQPRLPQHFQK